MKPLLPTCLSLCLFASTSASAFCGFYVAKADTKLFNEASKVVIVRDGSKTTLTMANDYQGDLKEFAVVFPVPVVPKQDDIKVARMETIEHLDAYTAPRLVEYHDRNPCSPMPARPKSASLSFRGSRAMVPMADNLSLGVTVEAEYQVEEYTVLILSAEESGGLETWLRQNGYKIPEGASEVLGSYIKQKMKFFVAKVNLETQSELGYTYLRPLRVTYESKKFALPIRLGMVNAKGDQDLFAFIITKSGRVECSNYKTERLPANMDLPVHLKEEFADFYKDMFSYQHARSKGKTVFLEYAWNMNWCDPCAADPLSPEQLRELGCSWVTRSGTRPGKSQAREAFVTRLHARYNAETFPEDLLFQETGDTQNFQGRYVLRHPWKGSSDDCYAARAYFRKLPERMMKEAITLHELTGWDLDAIRTKLDFDSLPEVEADPEFKAVVVQKAGSLEAFASEQGTTPEILKRWNDGLLHNRVRTNQTLKWPRK